jgi:hypothetical protein
MSERDTLGPEGPNSANTELATMKPPAIQPKVNIGPPMIGGSGRQIISEPGPGGEPEAMLGARNFNRRSLDRIGFALWDFLDKSQICSA